MNPLVLHLVEMNALELIEQLDVPAYVVDKERRIVFWNRKAAEMTGYDNREVVGLRCADQVLNHVDRTGIQVCPTELCPLYQAIKNGRSIQVPFAVFGLTRSGQRKPFSISGIPVRSKSGEILGAIEMFDDAEEIASDMILAIKVQESLVPSSDEHTHFFYRPSAGLGGDLIYYSPPWVGIVDISGHGVSAALVSMTLRATFDTVLGSDPPLHKLPKLLEEEVSKYTLGTFYFTAILGKREGDVFTFVNMGHPYPINLTRREVVRTNNVPFVGFGLSDEYSEDVVNTHDLADGNLLLYTDGLVELDTRHGLLGTSGLVQLLSPDDDPESVYLKVLNVRVGSLQEDDITMVLLRKA